MEFWEPVQSAVWSRNALQLVPVAGDRKENIIILLFVTKTGVAINYFHTRARTRIWINKGFEWASPPQWRIGHVLNLAVRPNNVRNMLYKVQVLGLLGYMKYTNKLAIGEYRGVLLSLSLIHI